MTTLEYNNEVIWDGIPNVRIEHPHFEPIRSLSCGDMGFITRPPDIKIDLEFCNDVPHIIRNMAHQGLVLDELTLRHENGVLSFQHCLVEKISRIGNQWFVTIKALRVVLDEITDGGKHFDNRSRACVLCRGHVALANIEHNAKGKIDYKIIDKMWNDTEVFEFVCCNCIKKFRKVE